MYFGSFQQLSFVNTGFPPSKVPIRRKLGSKEGAHVLLQTRGRTLNGELGAVFKRWYLDMDLEVEEIPVAA